jgi:hypothetical protein
MQTRLRAEQARAELFRADLLLLLSLAPQFFCELINLNGIDWFHWLCMLCGDSVEEKQFIARGCGSHGLNASEQLGNSTGIDMLLVRAIRAMNAFTTTTAQTRLLLLPGASCWASCIKAQVNRAVPAPKSCGTSPSRAGNCLNPYSLPVHRRKQQTTLTALPGWHRMCDATA